MGLCDAAETYYAQSRKRSELFWLGGVRAGLQFPQILDERVAAIQVMRSSGRCMTLPLQRLKPADAPR